MLSTVYTLYWIHYFTNPESDYSDEALSCIIKKSEIKFFNTTLQSPKKRNLK